MKPKPYPSQEQLQALFDYDRAGLLLWKKNGKVAGRNTPQGYRQVGIKGKIYYLHRLIWIWHYGDAGEKHVDHINHKRADNRIENLQLLSRRQNISKRQNGKLTGAYLRASGRWEALIWYDGRNRGLGTYDTEYEAHLTYLRAAATLER